jgi:localization factor PodJL
VTLEQAAASGDAVAQFQMGLQRLRDGDALLGANLVRKAAAQGLAAAQYRLAKLHERGEGVPKDLAEARRWTERAAFAGNRKAMHDLAVYYAQGEGVPQSYAAAVEWFRKAAEFGLADSQYNLAVLFAEGQGVTRNQTEALYWFRVAANNGDREAAAKVGDLQRQLKPDEAAAVITRADVFRARAANPRANGEFGPLPWAAATGR